MDISAILIDVEVIYFLKKRGGEVLPDPLPLLILHCCSLHVQCATKQKQVTISLVGNAGCQYKSYGLLCYSHEITILNYFSKCCMKYNVLPT